MEDVNVEHHDVPAEPGTAAKRRERMRVRVIGLHEDHDAFDRDDIAALSPDEKMALAGAMFAEQWLLMGGDADQLRLRRDIASLQRRGGLSTSLSTPTR